MSRTMKPSAITAHSRQVRQERMHGKNAKCKECGQTNPAVLVFSRPKLCQDCFAQRSDRSTIEQHHPAGAANFDHIVTLPANVHRILSDKQNDWNRETLQNPEQDPLLRAAAAVRGFSETCKAMIDSLLYWVGEFLEQLSEWLCDERGSYWWVATPLEAYTMVPAPL